MISGLRKVHASSVAFQHYWNGEVAPVLGSGYLPPLSQGFSRFMQHEAIAANMAAAVQHEESEGQTDPFDTHPALRDRVAALSAMPQGSAGDATPAASLLSNLTAWERRILGVVINDDWAHGLKPIEWERILESAYLPMWRERVQQQRKLLAPLTIATVPTSRLALARLGDAFAGATSDEALSVPEEVRIGRGLQLLTSAIAMALIPAGWTAQSALGDEIVLTREGEELRPFSAIKAVAEGKKAAADWRARAAALGIADVRLAGEVSQTT
jgi:heat shock protein HtpX